jgi:hypothetical protein
MPGWKIAGFTILGVIGLPIGAELLIDGSISVARAFGVTEAVIGLTLVAIGTSLPELATTIMAARFRPGVGRGVPCRVRCVSSGSRDLSRIDGRHRVSADRSQTGSGERCRPGPWSRGRPR